MDIKLVSKLNKTVTHSTSSRKSKQNFEYNKDADHYACPAGHMSYRKQHQVSQKKIEAGHKQRIYYYFDIDNCKNFH